MTAKDGKPCKKCGNREWYASGHCAHCSRERTREWVRNNPEQKAESDRLWAKNNAARVNARNRKWASANAEKMATLVRQWRHNNPEMTAAQQNRRRTNKTAAGGSYTAAEWNALVEHYGGKCLCCGRTDVRLTADHVVPVSKGGTSNIDNIQPLCGKCNSSKWDKTIDYRPGKGLGRWVQKKLFG